MINRDSKNTYNVFDLLKIFLIWHFPHNFLGLTAQSKYSSCKEQIFQERPISTTCASCICGKIAIYKQHLFCNRT